MNKPLFQGSAVAIVTPFTSNDNIDFDKLEELIEFQIKEGTDAIVICGTTGEASTMTDEEHMAAIKFAVEKIKGRLPVIAGTGSNYTKHAVELSQYAEAVGADAILTVTPYYNKTSQKGLIEHFGTIAKSIKIPVILYNVPSRTSLNINPETVYELSQYENIKAIKECNLSQIGEIVNLCGNDFTIYSGEDANILPCLALGGKGVISVMANIIPKDTHNIVKLFFEGKIEESRTLQLKTLNLIKALFAEVSPMPLKWVMNYLGINVGKCRLPLTDINDKTAELLIKALNEYGLNKDNLGYK